MQARWLVPTHLTCCFRAHLPDAVFCSPSFPWEGKLPGSIRCFFLVVSTTVRSILPHRFAEFFWAGSEPVSSTTPLFFCRCIFCFPRATVAACGPWVLLLWVLGSHSFFLLLRVRGVPDLAISFSSTWFHSLSVFSSCLKVSWSHFVFPVVAGFIIVSDTLSFSLLESFYFLGVPPFSPGNLFGIRGTGICSPVALPSAQTVLANVVPTEMHQDWSACIGHQPDHYSSRNKSECKAPCDVSCECACLHFCCHNNCSQLVAPHVSFPKKNTLLGPCLHRTQ